MTIAGFSPSSTKPVLDEARRLRPERSFQGAVCSMEGTITHDATTAASTAQQAMNKPSSTESSSPLSLRLSYDNGSAFSSAQLAFVYGTLKRGFGNHWLMEELMAGSHARFLGYACTKRRFPLVCGPFQVPFLLPSPSPSGHHVRGELYQVDSLAISRLDELEGVGKGHYERRPIYVRLIDDDAHARIMSATHTNDLDQSNGHARHVGTGLHMVAPTNDVDQCDAHVGNEVDMGINVNDVDKCNAHVGNEVDMAAHANDLDQSNVNMDEEMDASVLCTLAGPLSSCRMYMDPPDLDETDTVSSSANLSGYISAEAYFACADYGLRMADRAPHIPCYTEKEASTYVRRKDRPHGRTFLEHVQAWIEKQGLIH